MQETMTTIHLGGVLGKAFGKKHQRMVKTTSEAVRALCCTLSGFEKFMNTSKQRGLTFTVFKGKKNLGVDDLGYPVSGEVIRIMPIVLGSKRGLLQTILGGVLIAASFYAPGMGLGKTGTKIMLSSGISMAAGGVIQMISPQMPGLASAQNADNKASYAFGGVTNTASQGYPVPLLYGRRRIGGAIISAGIYVEDQQ